MSASRKDLADLLAANAAFYAAFAGRDLAAMDRLWASEHAVACIHPGWPPLISRHEVMTSWQGILGNPQQPAVRHLRERGFLLGSTAFVICLEILPEGTLVATNMFAKEAGAWRMVHHQSSPLSAGLEPMGESTPVKN